VKDGKRFMIVVDVNEAVKNPKIVEPLKKFFKVEVQKLPCGDYLLANRLFVERKSVTDYVNSLKGRLFEQLKLLSSARDEGYEVLLLIEGYWGLIKKFSKFDETSILRITDEIVLKWGIPILYSPNRPSTVKWMIAKTNSLLKAPVKRLPPLRTLKKPKSMDELCRYVLEGVVGPKTAHILLTEFKTLRNVFNAEVYELEGVKGIGRKTAEKVYRVANHVYHTTT